MSKIDFSVYIVYMEAVIKKNWQYEFLFKA